MKTLPEKFLKPYNGNETEDSIYKDWTNSGYFNPDNLKSENIEKDKEEKEKVFSIVLPPPNVTGVLHLGHAYEDSLQDTVVRFNRMKGKRTLWIPGTDSAAIATQARVEKNIQKEEGKNRYDLGREKLVKRVSKFAKDSENTIISQVKKMGASLDWSRYAYTLDEKRELAVTTAFKRMYDAGLIYRGNRIVNWDPKGQTTISDDEISSEERKATLYTFKYSKDFPISISTTRPETKVGDTAVAVHPEDERYQEFVGQTFEVNFCDIPIKVKIIADKEVEKDFGTGALGVTPSHSQIDWEIAERHGLEKKQVINEYAKMINCNSELDGKKVGEAREIIINWLRENNLLEKEEEVNQNVPTSERTGGIIEPLPKLQWFVDVKKEFEIKQSKITGIKNGDKISLKTLMKISVESGDINLPQENFKKIYFHWINNLRDWCISRQIWFGHRIPVWYKDEKIYCDTNPPKGEGWTQDEDVLDTWFSSALWTFSTLGWPENNPDLEKYHPTSFMSPAYEILPLWVSRMILMSGFHLGEIPFKTVMIHGLVRDNQGRKFSKSLNNGVNPVEMISKYGADALRMGLLSGTAIGNDLRFDEQKVKGYKHFGNKIWNATRFVLEKTLDLDEKKVNIKNLNEKHIETYKVWKEKLKDITEDLENYRLHLASEKLYDYFWKTFADVIIEECKKEIVDNTSNKLSAQNLLLILLREQIISLHPFMPFITEEIWKEIKNRDDDLLLATKWVA